MSDKREILGEESGLWKLYKRVEPFEIWCVVTVAIALLLPGIGGYTLIDPWETHYAEVARRILADNDWIHLTAEDKSFRSKPVLTFWLIAGSFKLFGIATDGSYSGELANSAMTTFAVRLPFVLFAVLGAVMTWVMLARLVNKRVAWISLLVTCTAPFYFTVGRQAITDMPMVACLMSAMACFAMAINKESDEPLKPIVGKITAFHFFLLAAILLVGGQLLYAGLYFFYRPHLAQGIAFGPGLVLAPLIVCAVLWCVSLHPKVVGYLFGTARKITSRQVWMFWFYLFVGVSVLAKGPPGIAVAGLVCLVYIVLTNNWRLLLRLEIPRGVVLVALVVLPWHVAMFLKDGLGWYNEYVHHHMLKRFGEGVHGDTGTFDYFASQLGIGLWPWVALVPAALGTVLYTANRDSQEGRVRLLVSIWAIAAVATFCISKTKFHHYIFPAVPAICLLVSFFIEDYLRGKVKKAHLLILAGIPIVALIARDFVGEQKQLIELSIYRYDRPWPATEPWFIDLSSTFMWLGLLFAALLVVLAVFRLRWYTTALLLGAAVGSALWLMHGYMPVAAQHWGQQSLHQTYYQERAIHGVDIMYFNLRDLHDDWTDGEDYKVKSVLPEDFREDLPMSVNLHVPGAGIAGDVVTMKGSVSRLGDDAFWISVPKTERAKVQELIERGARVVRSGRKPWVRVNADRLIAWQLNWHGEDFWSGGEIYGELEDTRTIFMKTDNKEFLEWIKKPERAGRTFFIITESGRAPGSLRSVLPTKRAKETLEVLDTSCNKFTLVRFTL